MSFYYKSIYEYFGRNSEIIAHYHICFVKTKKKKKKQNGQIFVTRELPVVVDEW